MIKESRYNKFDVFIAIIIISLIGGGSGGWMEPVRLLSVVFSPFVFFSLFIKRDRMIQPFVLFFGAWYLYMVVSLCWTSDVSNGYKELVYYLVHMLLFLELLLFSEKARNPIHTIAISWVVAFLLTSVVAIWEITTDQHLASAVQSNVASGQGGIGFSYHFAAVNFGNYNTYCTFICYCIPFIIYLLAQNNILYRFLALFSIIVGVFIVFYNASRGALLSIGVVFFIYGFSALKNKRNVRVKRRFFVLAIFLFILLSYTWTSIASHLLFRMENSDILKDTSRLNLWSSALTLFLSSYGLGTGVGSLGKSFLEIGHAIPPHNAFLELLVQYGVIVFLSIAVFLVEIFAKYRQSKNNEIRLFGYCALIPMPIYLIIDSGYLLKPQLWVLLASVYLLSNQTLE